MNEMKDNYYKIFILNNQLLFQQAFIYKVLNTQEKKNKINFKVLRPISADEYLIYANILISEFIHKITLNPNMDYIFESASSLLVRNIDNVYPITDNNDIDISQLNIIEKHLNKALLLSYNKGKPDIFRKTSLNILNLNIIKSFLLPYHSLVIKEEIINKCILILEFSKGLTYRRELYEIYSNKLLNNSLIKSENQKLIWPNKKLSLDEDIINNYRKTKKDNINSILYNKYYQEEDMDYNTFKDKYINIIPDSWTVCSITFDFEQNCFYISKYHKDTNPLIFHIPIKRHISHKKTTFFDFEKGVTYLRTLLYKDNNNAEMTQYSSYTDDEKINNISNEEKANWWNERIDLDRHLEELLIKMEISWIGGFKGIFCPIMKKYLKERLLFKKELEKLIGGMILKQDNFLEFDLNICDCFLYLKNEALDCELEDVIYYFLDYYKSCGIKVDYNMIDIDMYIRVLRKLLQKFEKLDLYDFDEHIIIIPDKHTEIIPWENIPILHDKPTSRILSLSLLRDRILLMNLENYSKSNIYKDKYIINTDSTYYVLNPGGDLMNTQNNFQNQFESQKEWVGISGKSPTEKEYLEGLNNYQLFMYFGHGGGECYIKGRSIRNYIKTKCAVTLLMGCSSGLLKTSGDYDSTGNSINYILGLSPALAANLWDVTDRDIDRLTQGLLEEWGVLSSTTNEDNESSSYYKMDLLINSNKKKEDSEIKYKTKNKNFSFSLCQALVLARRRCKLKFLIGAATVIYGIPVYNLK